MAVLKLTLKKVMKINNGARRMPIKAVWAIRPAEFFSAATKAMLSGETISCPKNNGVNSGIIQRVGAHSTPKIAGIKGATITLAPAAVTNP